MKEPAHTDIHWSAPFCHVTVIPLHFLILLDTPILSWTTKSWKDRGDEGKPDSCTTEYKERQRRSLWLCSVILKPTLIHLRISALLCGFEVSLWFSSPLGEYFSLVCRTLLPSCLTFLLEVVMPAQRLHSSWGFGAASVWILNELVWVHKQWGRRWISHHACSLWHSLDTKT